MKIKFAGDHDNKVTADVTKPKSNYENHKWHEREADRHEHESHTYKLKANKIKNPNSRKLHINLSEGHKNLAEYHKGMSKAYYNRALKNHEIL